VSLSSSTTSTPAGREGARQRPAPRVVTSATSHVLQLEAQASFHLHPRHLDAPDQGIWEIRGDPQQLTYSRVIMHDFGILVYRSLD
jgi:hypothetical protein